MTRARSGVCGHCGASGHYRPTCPVLRAAMPAPAPRVRVPVTPRLSGVLAPVSRIEAMAADAGRPTHVVDSAACGWGMW